LILVAGGVLAAGVRMFSHGASAGKREPAQVKEEPAAPARQAADKPARGGPRPVLGQALEAARALKESPQKGHVLVSIALIQAHLGERSRAASTLDEALRVAGRLAGDPSLTMALHWITKAQLRIGDNQGALRAAELMPDAGQKNHLLFLIASEQAA